MYIYIYLEREREGEVDKKKGTHPRVRLTRGAPQRTQRRRTHHRRLPRLGQGEDQGQDIAPQGCCVSCLKFGVGVWGSGFECLGFGSGITVGLDRVADAVEDASVAWLRRRLVWR